MNQEGVKGMVGLWLVVLTAVGIYLIVRIKKSKFIETSNLKKESLKVWDDGEVLVYSSGPVYSKHFKGAFLPASFLVEYQGKLVYIDPFGLGEADVASFILITHCHPDHYSKNDIERIYDEGTIMVCSKNVSKKLQGFHVMPILPGETFNIGDMKIEAVEAYTKGLPTHPKRDRNVGYVLTMGNFTLYHAGDTDYVDEISKVKNVTLALVPIAGGKRTMKTGEAVDLINQMKPRAVMPMHYIMGRGEEKKFADGIDSGIEVILYEEFKIKSIDRPSLEKIHI